MVTPSSSARPIGDRVCVVTGATGFLGRRLCSLLAERGWVVRGLARGSSKSFDSPRVSLHSCDLPDQIDESVFEGANVVIHCAYMSRHTTLVEARRVNEEGTARVLALARSNAASFVFISSTGAHPESLSYYGQSKLAIEGRLDLSKDLVIRPGLILGPGGLFQRISDSLAKFGLVPVFDGGHQRIQTIHVDDLCQAIVAAVDRGLTGRYVVASPESLELRDLFLAIGARMGKRVRLVPMPAGPMLLALRAAEGLGLRLPITSENVLGARSLRTQPSEADLEAIGVAVRDTATSLDDLVRNK